MRLKWDDLKRAIDNTPDTLEPSPKKYDLSKFDAYFKYHPKPEKYEWLKLILTHGTRIHLNSDFEKFPSRLTNSNPDFTLNELLGIGKQVLKWKQRKWVLGPFTPEQAAALQIVCNILFGVPKPGGDTRPILHLSDKT